MTTYEDICKKLGFNPLEDYTPQVSDFEDDSIASPFSTLTLEELKFLVDYLIKHRNEMSCEPNRNIGS